MTGCLITPFKELRRPRQDRPRPFVPNSSDYRHGRTEHPQSAVSLPSMGENQAVWAHATPPAACQM